MARRASSNLNATAIVGVAVIALLMVGGGMILLRGKKDSFDAPPLQMEVVLENANSLRGNEYSVEGKVSRRVVRNSGEGVSLIVESEGAIEEPLFILIPPEVEHVNIEREQRYAFKVRIGNRGVAVATAVKRL